MYTIYSESVSLSSAPLMKKRRPLFMLNTIWFVPFKSNCLIKTWNKKKLVSTTAMNGKKFKILNHIKHYRFRLNTPLPIPILPFVKVQTSSKEIIKSLGHNLLFLSHRNSNLWTRSAFILCNSSISIKHSPKPTMI